MREKVFENLGRSFFARRHLERLVGVEAEDLLGGGADGADAGGEAVDLQHRNVGFGVGATDARGEAPKGGGVEDPVAVAREICLRLLTERARTANVQELCSWAIPIQQRHFQVAREGSLKLAAEEDPNETS